MDPERSDRRAAALEQALGLAQERRHRADATAEAAVAEAGALRAELARLQLRSDELARELAAAETQLRDRANERRPPDPSRPGALTGKRILYVGGRPAAANVIRQIVIQRGGELQLHELHDVGLEDRKGLLDAAVAGAQLVVFPVDCIDHDSATRLRRACLRLGIPFRPLRTANVATFAALIADLEAEAAAEPGGACRRFA